MSLDFEIGYRRPPHAHRFQPGHSGNPKGRPRGAKSASTIILNAWNDKVSVKENGRSVRMTMGELITKQLFKKAAMGELNAIRYAFELAGSLSVETDQRPSVLQLRELLHFQD